MLYSTCYYIFCAASTESGTQSGRNPRQCLAGQKAMLLLCNRTTARNLWSLSIAITITRTRTRAMASLLTLHQTFPSLGVWAIGSESLIFTRRSRAPLHLLHFLVVKSWKWRLDRMKTMVTMMLPALQTEDCFTILLLLLRCFRADENRWFFSLEAPYRYHPTGNLRLIIIHFPFCCQAICLDEVKSSKKFGCVIWD